MANATSSDIKIGNYWYLAKIDPGSPGGQSYTNPFITRQSNSIGSRSDGEFGLDLVHCQRSWAQGEGQPRMVDGGENRYLSSVDMDISGSDAVLTLMKTVTKISGGTGQPNPGTCAKGIRENGEGVILAYPFFDSTPGLKKYFGRYDGSAWVPFGGGSPVLEIVGFDNNRMLAITTANNMIYISFDNKAIRIDHQTTKDWCSKLWLTTLGNDGTSLFGAQLTEDAATAEQVSYMWSFPLGGTPPAGGYAGTACSGLIEGKVADLRPHAGSMYALVIVANAELTRLYRYDGTNFVPYKEFPSGFIGQGIRSDGSVLYITGKQKTSVGNYRGQVYYVTGLAGHEALGNLGTIGDKVAGQNYDLYTAVAHGKSVYFLDQWYGGLLRYDNVSGGFSKNHRRSVVTAGDVMGNLCVYKGDVYFTALTDGIFKTNTATFRDNGSLQSSFIDFGLTTVPKLFKSITIAKPPIVDGSWELYYAIDGDYSNWTQCFFNGSGTIDLESEPGLADADSSANYKKLTCDPINVKAHSLAYKLVLNSSYDHTIAPQIHSVAVNAIQLNRVPGRTTARKVWSYNLRLSKHPRNRVGVRSPINQAYLDALKTLYENQTPTTITPPEGGTFSAIITNLTNVISHKANPAHEPLVAIELTEL